MPILSSHGLTAKQLGVRMTEKVDYPIQGARTPMLEYRARQALDLLGAMEDHAERGVRRWCWEVAVLSRRTALDLYRKPAIIVAHFSAAVYFAGEGGYTHKPPSGRVARIDSEEGPRVRPNPRRVRVQSTISHGIRTLNCRRRGERGIVRHRGSS